MCCFLIQGPESVEGISLCDDIAKLLNTFVHLCHYNGFETIIRCCLC